MTLLRHPLNSHNKFGFNFSFLHELSFFQLKEEIPTVKKKMKSHKVKHNKERGFKS
jgi:hypothetical protein